MTSIVQFIFYFWSFEISKNILAALKSGPVHRPLCSLYFTFGPLRSAEIFWEIRKYDRFRFIYSKQFNYLNLIWIYISHCMTSLLKLEITVWLSGFHCQFIHGHWRGLVIRNRSVWPTLFLLNVFTALKGTHFYISFVVTATGFVPCGSRKKRSRTSSIVQFIFYFWSFEINRNILRNQKIS